MRATTRTVALDGVIAYLGKVAEARRDFAGVDPARTMAALRGTRPYLQRRAEFMEAARGNNDFVIGRPFPCFAESGEHAGQASGHYFHQDLYVAQQVFAATPERHVDVGSRIDGFVAHVASFRRIDVYDIRPMPSSIPNVIFGVRDLTRADPTFDACTDSLSSLHAVEHFGLGRYGDPLDYYGYRNGFTNLSRMVKPRGVFYFSVPISELQRVEFDAHRVFALPYLIRELISPLFEVERFAYVDDAGDLHINQDATSSGAARTFGLAHGCGIFTLRKLAS